MSDEELIKRLLSIFGVTREQIEYALIKTMNDEMKKSILKDILR